MDPTVNQAPLSGGGDAEDNGAQTDPVVGAPLSEMGEEHSTLMDVSCGLERSNVEGTQIVLDSHFQDQAPLSGTKDIGDNGTQINPAVNQAPLSGDAENNGAQTDPAVDM